SQVMRWASGGVVVGEGDGCGAWAWMDAAVAARAARILRNDRNFTGFSVFAVCDGLVLCASPEGLRLAIRQRHERARHSVQPLPGRRRLQGRQRPLAPTIDAVVCPAM